MAYLDTYKKIAEDAASMSIEGNSTELESTVYGLGTVFGRVLMRLGELTVRGMDNIHIRIRLRRIRTSMHTQPPTQWPPRFAKHALEYQRQVSQPNALLGRPRLPRVRFIVCMTQVTCLPSEDSSESVELDLPDFGGSALETTTRSSIVLACLRDSTIPAPARCLPTHWMVSATLSNTIASYRLSCVEDCPSRHGPLGI